MTRPRIIPVVLIDSSRRVVKTEGFGRRTYIGDPFNVVRLFNEKEVDEIVILDIDASIAAYSPDLGFLRELSSECFMPMAYGGGLKDASFCEQVCAAGVEKLVFKTAVFDSSLIGAVSKSLGAQAVIGCFDYVGSGTKAQLHESSLAVSPKERLIKSIQSAVASGIGEVIIQSVDRDGRRVGYDLKTIEIVADELEVPTIALGGARDLDCFSPALRAGASAVASGSAFCFIGSLRAVLITYPNANFIKSLYDTQ